MRKVILALLILAIPASTMAAMTWYTTSASWDTARTAGGYTSLWSQENYKEANAPVGGFAVDDPLKTGVPNNPYFPVGLLGKDLQVQCNQDTTGMTQNPRGPGAGGLALFTAGWGQVLTNIVISNYLVDSHDVMFGPQTVNAVGFAPVVYNGTATLIVKAFDKNNALLGQTTTPADPTGTLFLGAVSDVQIARINLYATNGNGEGTTNLSTYIPVPEPATLSLLALGLLALRRR